MRNDVILNMLGLEGKKVYMLRSSKYESEKKVANLLLIDDGEGRHYTAVKDLSRLLRNCLHGFTSEISRDKHFEYPENTKQ